MIARRLVIHGRVQGVFYRDWAVRTAQALGADGWVRNREDGTVEALVEGPEDVVDAFVTAARDGPSAGRVDRIEETGVEPAGRGGFERR